MGGPTPGQIVRRPVNAVSSHGLEISISQPGKLRFVSPIEIMPSQPFHFELQDRRDRRCEGRRAIRRLDLTAVQGREATLQRDELSTILVLPGSSRPLKVTLAGRVRAVDLQRRAGAKEQHCQQPAHCTGTAVEEDI